MGRESLFDHFNQNEIGYHGRMLCIGWINNLGFGLAIAFQAALASKWERNMQFAQFMVAVQAAPILARMINANYLIQISHEFRMFYVSLSMVIAYCFLAAAIVYPDDTVGLNCASVASLLFQATRAIGEATLVGYLKAIPQELICTFGTGTGLGDMFQSVCNVMILHYGLDSMDYTISFVFTVLPYFIFFSYFEYHRLSHRQHKNIFKIEVVGGGDEILASMELEEFKRKRAQGITDSIQKAPLRTAKTMVVDDEHISFDASDIEAYQDEQPIPIVKQAYLEYERNKRKAKMRRAQTVAMNDDSGKELDVASMHDEIQEGSVDMVMRDEHIGPYDDPNRNTVYVHERPQNSMLIDTGAEEQDQVYAVNAVSAQINDALQTTQTLTSNGLTAAAETASQFAELMQNNLGFFVPNLNVVEDVDQFRYDVKDNRRIQTVAVARVFKKSGSYIFQLGVVNFLEQIIVNLFLVIHCFNREQEIFHAGSESDLNDSKSVELPFLRTHEYVMLTFAYNLGSVLSLSTLQTVTLERPYMPTIFQAFNVIMWIANIHFNFVTNFNIVFVWLMWVGCQQGTDYTNFLFLANSKTNMHYDMNLNYYERELVCNLLLISNDVGGFFSSVIGYAVLQYNMPEVLFSPPN